MRGLLFLSAVCASVATSIALKDCSSGKSFFKVKSLDFTPVNPVPGQNGTLHSLYEVPMSIEAGIAKYSCTLNGLPVFSETYDLCSQTACPITGGTHDDYSTSAVPDTTGKVSCTIDWRDTAGAQLLCIQMIMSLSVPRSVRLRGSAVNTFPAWHPDLIVGTNLSENKTCSHVDDYDPLWPAIYVYESVATPASVPNGTSTNTQTGSSSVVEKRMSLALAVLRG